MRIAYNATPKFGNIYEVIARPSPDGQKFVNQEIQDNPSYIEHTQAELVRHEFLTQGFTGFGYTPAAVYVDFKPKPVFFIGPEAYQFLNTLKLKVNTLKLKEEWTEMAIKFLEQLQKKGSVVINVPTDSVDQADQAEFEAALRNAYADVATPYMARGKKLRALDLKIPM